MPCGSRGCPHLRQQPLRFRLRQPASNHRLRHLPLAIKLAVMNLLTYERRLNDEDWKAIAYALRRKGHLAQYLNWEIAATKARPQLSYVNLDYVIAALREAAPVYRPAHETIRKLQSKGRKAQAR